MHILISGETLPSELSRDRVGKGLMGKGLMGKGLTGKGLMGKGRSRIKGKKWDKTIQKN